MFSPRVWGCTVSAETMIQDERRFPHVCGGVPHVVGNATDVCKFSPRVWGCTEILDNFERVTKVFPTCVGVYLISKITLLPDEVFPTCVGVYRWNTGQNIRNMVFSPRVWGCTVGKKRQVLWSDVFPTCVGVYRK